MKISRKNGQITIELSESSICDIAHNLEGYGAGLRITNKEIFLKYFVKTLDYLQKTDDNDIFPVFKEIIDSAYKLDKGIEESQNYN